MSTKEKPKKNSNELSFTKKCIILSNIQNETNKIIFNSFDFIPVVKLYSSTQKQETFNYTRIKGALFLLQDKETNNYHIRIYDSKNYSLKFNLEINKETRKNYIKVESNFYCFNLKYGYIGFLFASSEEASMFKKILDIGEIDQIIKDQYEQYNLFPLKDSDNMFLDVIDALVEELRAKYNNITGEIIEYKYQQIDNLIFSGFLELSQLLGNAEFDHEDNLYNIFIDKKFPRNLFKKIFHNYDKNHLYPIRPISIDYLHIYNKSNYVDFLVGHLMNNFKEQVNIYKKRKESNIKEKMNKNLTFKESNKNRQNVPIDDVSRKTVPAGEIGIIEEDPNEDGSGKNKTFGKFLSGLNPFK